MLPARPYRSCIHKPETTGIDHAMKIKYVERSEADFDSVEWGGQGEHAMSAGRETRTVRIFIDTNIFIEMMDLRNVDWRLMFPGLTDLHIIFSIHVIDELDKLKTDKCERKRGRALAALKTIDQVETGPIDV